MSETKDKRNWPLRIYDMKKEIRHLNEFKKDISKGGFYADIKIQYAIVRSIEILGEASKKIPDDIRAKYPAIPWVEMSKMRDVIVHDYFNLRLDILWEIINTKIPEFENILLSIDIPEEL